MFRKNQQHQQIGLFETVEQLPEKHRILLVIRSCEIRENASDGMLISGGSGLTVQQCQINRNGGWGVQLQEGSSATVEECSLLDNGKGAWQIASDCQVHQKGNTEAM
jgi:hypothetical protein